MYDRILIKSDDNACHYCYICEHNVLFRIKEPFPYNEPMESYIDRLPDLKCYHTNTEFSSFEDLDFTINSIGIILSYACNMQCKYCSAVFHDDKDQIDLDTLKEFIVSILKKNNSSENRIHIRFYGGEPLLSYDIIRDIVLFLKHTHYNFAFSLSTNGTLFDQQKLKFLFDNNFFITISLDGPPHINDKYRVFKDGTSTSQTILTGINKIMQTYPDWMKTNISINSVVIPDISILKRQEFIKSLGVRKVDFIHLDSMGIVLLGLDVNIYREYYQEQMHILLNYNKEKIVSEDFIDIVSFPGRSTLHALKRKYHNRRRYYCGAGTSSITITPEGKIVPCHLFTKTKILTEDNCIGSISNGINYDIVKKQYKYYTKVMNSCVKCGIFKTCTILCIYKALTDMQYYTLGNNCASYNMFLKTLITMYIEIEDRNPKGLDNYFNSLKSLLAESHTYISNSDIEHPLYE